LKFCCIFAKKQIMIQRIQTLFLLGSLVCTSLFFFLPFGHLITKDLTEIAIIITGVSFPKGESVLAYPMLPLLIMFIIINLITLASIFLFKKRMLQIRLSIFNAIVQLGSFGMLFFYLADISKKSGLDYSTGILVILPVVAAILSFLAMRAIAKDEALVRSISRLRK
jgi:4-amino-4-deoxy-L-arabinose transferase-like glycosyltransferase